MYFDLIYNIVQNIIAIQGNKNSGKDEFARMLQFVLSTPRVFHKYWIYKYLNKLFPKQYKIVRYADKIKEILSTLLNVPLYLFEDREFKEKCYIDFNTLKLTHFDNIENSEKILSDSKFSREIKRLDKNLTKNYYLSIRQLLQYFGTEIMRHYFGNNLWILTTFKDQHEKLIISDQRFINENNVATKNNAFIIHITRPGVIAGNHSSESELVQLFLDCKYDILLENDGTLKDLFNKAVQIVR